MGDSDVLDLYGFWINEVNNIKHVICDLIPEEFICLSYEDIKLFSEIEIFI